MVYVTKFRANDLNPSKGKQIEFNQGAIANFFGFTNSECTVTIECYSLVDNAFKKVVKAYFKLSPERGDYKIYQNEDGTPDLKDVFLQNLHLTATENIDDYYALKKKSDDKFILYYVPKNSLFLKFFPLASGDQIVLSSDFDGEVLTGADKGTLQLITYGAPGTGKSHKIDKCTNESNSIRVTFHPDTDYAAFVGAYKPTMERTDKDLLSLQELQTVLQSLKDRGETRPEQKLGAEFWQSFEKLTPAEVKSILDNDSMYAEVMKGVAVGEYLSRIENGGKQIVYSFVPQAFMKAYVEAWKRYTDASLQGDAKNYYLVIEEINRGNCAQIFGDMFQLLDRADNGFSAYAISPDDDIQKFLETDKNYKLVNIPLSDDIKKQTESGEKVIATAADIKTGKKLVLPPNLYIRATMNTSDQSLFPMDSAFKRRWDWKYVPIKDAGKGWKIKFGNCEVDWWKFLVAINKIVKDVTSSVDKQLGYFFVKAKDSVIDAEMFVNKVAFYLWNDVFKDCELDGDAFKIERDEGEVDVLAFQDFFKEDGEIDEKVLKDFLTKLVTPSEPENGAAPQSGTGA